MSVEIYSVDDMTRLSRFHAEPYLKKFTFFEYANGIWNLQIHVLRL